MILNKIPFYNIFQKHLITYPSPSNLNYFWSFGSLALVALIVQVLSGIFLTMHYTATGADAFGSIEHIMRDVNNGWLIRYIHANFASAFFIMLYFHIGKALYYQSYLTRRHVWMSGIIIFLLVIITSFLGYVLPWGQMSYWAATVIVSLTTVVPYGELVKAWILGGFALDDPTLQRFYTFHFLFPIIIVALVLVHFALLHMVSSGTPLGIENKKDMVTLFPYFWMKDILSVVIFFLLFLPMVFFAPEYLMHPDNNIPANPMQTPEHIVPEWYFLLFYGILRSVPNKAGGVALLAASIIAMLLMPLFVRGVQVKGLRFNSFMQYVTGFFFADCMLLSLIGSQPIVEPYYTMGQVCTVLYFLYFLIVAISCREFIPRPKKKEGKQNDKDAVNYSNKTWWLFLPYRVKAVIKEAFRL
jgi:ubiquinol-cytochrome c reductase cytochrome b subunit